MDNIDLIHSVSHCPIILPKIRLISCHCLRNLGELCESCIHICTQLLVQNFIPDQCDLSPNHYAHSNTTLYFFSWGKIYILWSRDFEATVQWASITAYSCVTKALSQRYGTLPSHQPCVLTQVYKYPSSFPPPFTYLWRLSWSPSFLKTYIKFTHISLLLFKTTPSPSVTELRQCSYHKPLYLHSYLLPNILTRGVRVIFRNYKSNPVTLLLKIFHGLPWHLQ